MGVIATDSERHLIPTSRLTNLAGTMEFGLSELYLQRKKGFLKTYVVSCAIYLRNLHVLHFFFYFTALGCSDIPDRSVPEEFC